MGQALQRNHERQDVNAPDVEKRRSWGGAQTFSDTSISGRKGISCYSRARNKENEKDLRMP